MELPELVEIRANVMMGKPCLAGTRFPFLSSWRSLRLVKLRIKSCLPIRNSGRGMFALHWNTLLGSRIEGSFEGRS
jgi:hypothetical protein